MNTPADMLENRTYDEIEIGESASLQRTVTEDDIRLFAQVSGDYNPAHLDAEYAANTPFGGVIAHGMFGGALISTVLGTQLPGPGTVYMEQSLKFTRPVRPGDALTITLTCTEKGDKQKVVFDCVVVNQDGKAVIKGEAVVKAPTEKLRIAKAKL